MKLKFKHQAYQTNAVDAVVDCFSGQPYYCGNPYRVDPGLINGNRRKQQVEMFDSDFRNHDVVLTQPQLLDNIHGVQRRQNLDLSTSLVSDKKTGCQINLDIEMETGTGKTYC